MINQILKSVLVMAVMLTVTISNASSNQLEDLAKRQQKEMVTITDVTFGGLPFRSLEPSQALKSEEAQRQIKTRRAEKICQYTGFKSLVSFEDTTFFHGDVVDLDEKGRVYSDYQSHETLAVMFGVPDNRYGSVFTKISCSHAEQQLSPTTESDNPLAKLLSPLPGFVKEGIKNVASQVR